MMLYLARVEVSLAMSTSTIRPLAASRLDWLREVWSRENCRREVVAPFAARRVAMFSRAVVKKLTPSSSRPMVVVPEEAANDLPVVSAATLVSSVALVKFRALSRSDLLMLTTEPG